MVNMRSMPGMLRLMMNAMRHRGLDDFLMEVNYEHTDRANI